MINDSLIIAASILYAMSSLLFLAAVIHKRTRLAKIATAVMLAALIAQACAFVSYHIHGISSAAFGLREFSLSLSLIITATFLVFQIFTKTRLLGVFVAPLVLFLSVMEFFAGARSMQAVASGGVIGFHIALAIAGEALFTVATLSGALFLIQEMLIRKKRAGGFIRLLPPLGDLDKINHYSLVIGLPLMTIGLAIGALYATRFWGLQIFCDVKILWALTAWIAYGAILYCRGIGGWHGRKAAWVTLSVFVVLLALFFLSLHSSASWHRIA